VSWLISSKNFEMSRFSCTNLTLASVSALSSMAWLKPFSPPARGARARAAAAPRPPLPSRRR